jgi:hypothetical protein
MVSYPQAFSVQNWDQELESKRPLGTRDGHETFGVPNT